jgi:hypothetical protein
MGDLAVARSLGDVSCTPYISFKPYVSESIINTDTDDFLIIGCDGLWDVIEDQMACDIVRRYPKELSSAVLRDFAYLFASGDNISVIVIHFGKHQPLKASAPIKPSWVSPSKPLNSSGSPNFHKILTRRSSIAYEPVMNSNANVGVKKCWSETPENQSYDFDNFCSDGNNTNNNNNIIGNNNNNNNNNNNTDCNDDQKKMKNNVVSAKTVLYDDSLSGKQNNNYNTNNDSGKSNGNNSEENVSERNILPSITSTSRSGSGFFPPVKKTLSIDDVHHLLKERNCDNLVINNTSNYRSPRNSVSPIPFTPSNRNRVDTFSSGPTPAAYKPTPQSRASVSNPMLNNNLSSSGSAIPFLPVSKVDSPTRNRVETIGSFSIDNDNKKKM